MKTNFRQLSPILQPAALGLYAFVVNLIVLKLGGNDTLPYGNLLLLMASVSFGGVGAGVAAIVSELPLLLSHSHDPAQVIQILIFMVSFGYACEQLRNIQVALILIPIWWFSAGVTAILAPVSFPHLVSAFCFDIFLLALARTVFLSRTMASVLFGRLYRLSVLEFVPEMLFIVNTTAVGIFLFSSVSNTLLIDELLTVIDPLLCLLYLITLFAIAPLLGYMLIKTLISEYGVDLKNIINTDYSKNGFVAVTRKILNPSVGKTDIRPGVEETKETNPFLHHDKALLALSSDTTILYCSPLAKELLRGQSEQFIGKLIDQSELPTPIIEIIVALLSVAKLRGSATDEARIAAAKGMNGRFIEVTVELTEASSSSGNGYIVKFKDITEKRTIEAELLQAKKNESLGRMAEGISHTVSDALTVIRGIAGIGLKDSTNHTQFEQIAAVAKNAGEMVSQLLEYAGDQEDVRRKVDLVTLLNDKIEFLRQTVSDSFQITINCNVLSLPVEANSHLFIQAICQLILNAKESFSESTGDIEIELEKEEISLELSFIQPGARPGEYARLRIKDTGEGMSPDVLARAFDPHYTTKTTQGHSGLGLSVVFAIVRAHDGFLTVESSLGKGSSISIYLPLVENKMQAFPGGAEEKMTSQTSPEESNPFLKMKKGLVIEDDAQVRRVLELLLQQLGIEVTTCTSGEEALEEIHGADFFISDYILPGKTGLEIAQILVDKFSLPGLITSGKPLDHEVLPEKTFILNKPFGHDELLDALKKIGAL